MLGKLSGRAGFAARVRALSIDLPGDAFTHAFERFQRLADVRREVGDEDLRVLCAAALVAFGIFSLIAHWNDYFWPLVMTTDDTVPSARLSTSEGAATSLPW